MSQKIADLQHTLGEVAKGSPAKLRCAICRRPFFARDSNGVAYWMRRHAAEKAVLHLEHRCENCLIGMAWDIDRDGRFAECSCAEDELETMVKNQYQPFCPIFD
jgi:hypothetical protein